MYYDLAERGIWPEAGGLNIQTAAFFDAWRWFRDESVQWYEETHGRKEQPEAMPAGNIR